MLKSNENNLMSVRVVSPSIGNKIPILYSVRVRKGKAVALSGIET